MKEEHGATTADASQRALAGWEHKFSRQLGTLGSDAARALARTAVAVHLDAPTRFPARHTAIEIVKNLALLGVRHISFHAARTPAWTDSDVAAALELGSTLCRMSAEWNADVSVRVANGLPPENNSEEGAVQAVVYVGGDMPLARALNVQCRSGEGAAVPFVFVTARAAAAAVFVDLGDDSHRSLPRPLIPMLSEEPYLVLAAAPDTPTSSPPENTTATVALRVPDAAVCRAFGEGSTAVLLTSDSPPPPCTLPSLSPDARRTLEALLPPEATRRGQACANLVDPVAGDDQKPVVRISLPPDADATGAAQVCHWLQTCAVGLYPIPVTHELRFHALGSDGEVQRRDEATANVVATLVAAPQAAAEPTTRRLRNVTLHPLCVLAAAFAAHEVAKLAAPRTTRPLHQWLTWDAAALVVSDASDDLLAPPLDASPAETLRAFFGASGAAQLEAARLFQVGCGAVGCEYLKNYAALGFPSRRGGGFVFVTDGDGIEVSNLTRQLLFRPADVGQLKSAVGARAAASMNSDLDVRHDDALVCRETESRFGDEFWAGHDCLVSAVDSVAARQYCDRRAAIFGTPFLDVGTQGARYSFFAAVPPDCATYGEQRAEALVGHASAANADGDGVPVCTVKHFPHTPAHCIQWGRSAVEELLDKVPTLLRRARAAEGRPEHLLADLARGAHAPTTVRLLLAACECLTDPSSADTHDTEAALLERCARFAWLAYHSLVRDPLLDLIARYPEGCTTTKGGPFWGGHKRFPAVPALARRDVAISDDSSSDDDARALAFMRATAALLHNAVAEDAAQPIVTSDSAACHAACLRCLREEPVPVFLPADLADMDPAIAAEVHSAADPADGGGGGGDLSGMDGVLSQLKSLLLAPASSARPRAWHPRVALSPRVTAFEKDDDANAHVAFVHAGAVIRAAAYRVPAPSYVESKLIAGRIVPAIITTTAVAAAVGTLELIKALLGPSFYRRGDGGCRRPMRGQGNLAVGSVFAFPTPPPQPQHTAVVGKTLCIACPEGFTCRTIVTVDLFDDAAVTFGELVAEHLEPQLHAEVSTLLFRGTRVWDRIRGFNSRKLEHDDVAACVRHIAGVAAWDANRCFEGISASVSVVGGPHGDATTARRLTPPIVLRRRACFAASKSLSDAIEAAVARAKDGGRHFRGFSTRQLDAFLCAYQLAEDVLLADDAAAELAAAWAAVGSQGNATQAKKEAAALAALVREEAALQCQ